MGNPYPATIADVNTETRIAGSVTFTDAANQPGVQSGSIAVADLSTAARDAIFPWYVPIDILQPPATSTNWAATYASPADGPLVTLIDALTSGAQNDSATWPLTLGAGTWNFYLIHSKSTNRGIYTVKIDGVSVGTIDGYAAAQAVEAPSTISGIAVAASGKHTVQIIMATKNAASSNYFGVVASAVFERTA